MDTRQRGFGCKVKEPDYVRALCVWRVCNIVCGHVEVGDVSKVVARLESHTGPLPSAVEQICAAIGISDVVNQHIDHCIGSVVIVRPDAFHSSTGAILTYPRIY